MASTHPALVDRAKKILLTPKTEWPVIDGEPSTIGDIYRNYVLILAAIPAIAGLIGNALFGYSALGVTFRVPIVTALSSAIVTYVLSLISVYVLALIIDALAPTFGGTKNQTQAFKVAAYSNTAGWVAGILTIIPQLGPIAALLSLYGFYLLYLGLPGLMKAPKDKALGYTIVTVIAAVILFMVVGAVVAAVSAMFTPTFPIGAQLR
ncbi:MAG: Yip1 family protein [Pseudomonadota bacterium]